MHKRPLLCVLLLTLLALLANCGGSSSSGYANMPSSSQPGASPAPSGAAGPTLTALGITPVAPTIARTTAQEFVATGVFSDGSTQDLTQSASWSTSNENVASLIRPGLVRGLTPGQATISASLSGVSTRVNLTVSNASLRAIQVTQAAASIARDTAQQFVATGLFDDLSTQDLTDQVTWSSDNASVSFSSVEEGQAQATVPVSAVTVTASLGGVTGTSIFSVTPASLVSLHVTPPFSEVTLGTSVDYKATGRFSDGSTQDLTTAVLWTSSLPEVATITDKGRARSTGTGEATLTARAGRFSDSATLFVKPARLDLIRVSRDPGTIPKGTFSQFHALGVFSDGTTSDLTTQVAWTSSNPAVVISNARPTEGLAYGADVTSSVSISARLGDIEGANSLTVTPAVLRFLDVRDARPLPKGTTLQLSALGTYSDSTTQDLTGTVSWTSSALGVATISSPGGLARGVALGNCTIIASQQGISANTTLQVTPATLTQLAVAPLEANLRQGNFLAYRADGTYSDGRVVDVTNSVTWTSSRPADVEISNEAGSKGQAFGVNATTVTIEAAMMDLRVSTILTVTPASPILYVANDRGSVTAFTVGADGGLVPVPGSPFAAPARLRRLSSTPDGRFLYGASDQGLPGYAINQYNGVLAPLPGSPYASGRFEALTAGRPGWLYAVASNEARVYAVDQGTGRLTPSGPPAPVGRTPEEVVLDPSGRYLYVAASEAVSGFLVDAGGGGLAPLPGSPFPLGETTRPLSMVMDPLGRSLYLGHLLLPDLTGFSRTASGALVKLPGSPWFSGGKQAGGVAMDPTGRFLIAANFLFQREGDPGTLASLPVAANGDLGDPVEINEQVKSPTAVTVEPLGRFVYAANSGDGTVSAFTLSTQGKLTLIPGSPFAAGGESNGLVVVP